MSKVDGTLGEVKELLLNPKVYVASPISTEGDKMFVNSISNQLRVIGYDVYSPIEDESINDKSNDPQPEDIYINDLKGINYADIIVVNESGREQVGTHVELGITLERIGTQKILKDCNSLWDTTIVTEKGYVVFREISRGAASVMSPSREERKVLYVRSSNLPEELVGMLRVASQEGYSIEKLIEGDVSIYTRRALPPRLIAFTSNFRLNEPQIKYGKPSASMNHLALGGIIEEGDFVDTNMSEGFIKYMSDNFKIFKEVLNNHEGIAISLNS